MEIIDIALEYLSKLQIPHLMEVLGVAIPSYVSYKSLEKVLFWILNKSFVRLDDESNPNLAFTEFETLKKEKLSCMMLRYEQGYFVLKGTISNAQGLSTSKIIFIHNRYFAKTDLIKMIYAYFKAWIVLKFTNDKIFIVSKFKTTSQTQFHIEKEMRTSN